MIFALRAERASLRRGLRSVSRFGRGQPPAERVLVTPYQSGPGPSRAALAARRAVEQGADALVSWGLAGGLAAGVESGHVVVPARVLSARGEPLAMDPAWQARLAASLGSQFTVHRGDLLGVERVLGSAAAKADAARATGAVAADMESRAVAEVALAARLPVAVVRVIADEARDGLPAGVERWIDASGRTRWAPLLSLVVAPGQWPAFLTLARQSRRGLATLGAIAGRLAADSFCWAGGREGVP